LSRKRGLSGLPGEIVFAHGSTLVPPASVSANDHPARDLAAGLSSPLRPHVAALVPVLQAYRTAELARAMWKMRCALIIRRQVGLPN
jgi:hypothetical protein